ncbi:MULTISPECIES: WXG100 family type VII secretion target [Gordonia]|uniref:WXG100 family type VII secretion target n=1 Tax=Gordonia TaxID=2053 RepID=UPI0002A63599|nr:MULTISPECIES: WXG100 family type VII secretion target [Gordonia]MDV7102686.1 WXG100 family type VII secretion target [Gordonia amicalis]MDV7175924.1 WXG100 family type VII secretion target [Gordonia amicalis]NKX79742.1 WXG100 family type VII secretion target [Gordonia amicalis]GAC55203.1 hypothetical protein GOAMI_47_00460 [Gordonia amicalis NBRC 100051 = JCM 11271]
MELTAHLAALRAVSQDVTALHGDVTEEWSTITKRAEDLFGVSWSGTAADSYAEPWANCCEGVDHILNGLSSTGRLLVSAAQVYAEGDTAGAEGIKGATPFTPLKLP